MTSLQPLLAGANLLYATRTILFGLLVRVALYGVPRQANLIVGATHERSR
jgi:hypothetical protein